MDYTCPSLLVIQPSMDRDNRCSTIPENQTPLWGTYMDLRMRKLWDFSLGMLENKTNIEDNRLSDTERKTVLVTSFAYCNVSLLNFQFGKCMYICNWKYTCNLMYYICSLIPYPIWHWVFFFYLQP